MNKSVWVVNIMVLVAFMLGYFTHDPISIAYANLKQRLKSNESSFVNSTIPSARAVRVNNGESNEVALPKVFEDEKRLIVFWSMSCSYCKNLLKHLKESTDRLKKEGVRVITVSIDDNPELLSCYKRTMGYSWPVFSVSEKTEQIQKKYELFSVPVIYVVDLDNTIEERIVGADIKRLDSAIDELTAE